MELGNSGTYTSCLARSRFSVSLIMAKTFGIVPTRSPSCRAAVSLGNSQLTSFLVIDVGRP